MPNRKEIQWSQLRVGALVAAAMAVLTVLIFLMSGASGGLFARKLILRCYFDNAAGLKQGAPVTLEGVTIGNVTRMRIVPERNPTPVEVTMQVGAEYRHGLHADTTAAIAQAGVLGDSYVDLSSEHAKLPPPANNAELHAAGSPSIQDVIRSSDDSIVMLQTLVSKLDKLIDAINSGRGTAGKFVTDPSVYNKLDRIAGNLQSISDNINSGKGTLGKLINDDTLYTRANSAVDRLDRIVSALDEGKGTAGKLLRDDSLYKNLNSAVANTNELLAGINAGHGALGKIAKDRAFAEKLDDTVTHLDAILKGINEGKGTLGQLAQNRVLFDNANGSLEQARELLKSVREDPKKYLVIHMKVF